MKTVFCSCVVETLVETRLQGYKVTLVKHKAKLDDTMEIEIHYLQPCLVSSEWCLSITDYKQY